ncbi:MAG: hypothetical protein JWO58_3343 [Chitinophagaceae bacterium]|nr:hypothetical protein [Chitinophagaceae bacterium]
MLYYAHMAIDWTKIQKKYAGHWVALAKDERTVVGSGRTAREALEQAKKKKVAIPLLTRMPERIVSYVGSYEILL